MVDAPDWIPGGESLELPDNMNPKKAGIVDAFFALLLSGLGAVIVTPFIGFAAVAQGFVMAIESLLGGLRTFVVNLIDGFISPFVTAVDCGGFIKECSMTVVGTQEASAFVVSGSILGFALSILVVGGMVYVTGRGVRRAVSYVG